MVQRLLPGVGGGHLRCTSFRNYKMLNDILLGLFIFYQDLNYIHQEKQYWYVSSNNAQINWNLNVWSWYLKNMAFESMTYETYLALIGLWPGFPFSDKSHWSLSRCLEKPIKVWLSHFARNFVKWLMPCIFSPSFHLITLSWLLSWLSICLELQSQLALDNSLGQPFSLV